MNWDTDLVHRALIVVKELAFEIVDSNSLGMKVVVVTNCLDEKQKAIFIPKDGQPFEKCSTFQSESKREEVTKILQANWISIMEEYGV